MKIIYEGKEYDAPTVSEIEKEYFHFVPPRETQEIECYCEWVGVRGALIHEIDIDQMHPKNRNNPHCNMMDRRGCHYTAYEKCPRCKRVVFADGMFVQRRRGTSFPKGQK